MQKKKPSNPYENLFASGGDLPADVLQLLAQDMAMQQQQFEQPAEEQFNEDINEAILISMYEQEQHAEEEKLLREVMKISALEHQKQIGALSLDHLKKRAKKPESVAASVAQAP